MNNEPVAWMHKTIPSWVSTFIHPETELDEWIPLYTHPAKTLTDEEIKQVWNDNLAVMGNDLQFAKAILRKAHEIG
jgi:hypothetical protein